IVPDRVREQQEADPGEVLKADGGNAAAVLRRLRDQGPNGYGRVCRLLARAVEGVERGDHALAGDKETLRFRQDIGLKHPWDFPAISMSDGTLRLLGLLLAVYQPGHASVVAIEEPEATVHPAIAELVLQVLRDAARERQILITTHSPDLLDSTGLRDEEILAVTKERGTTLVAPLSPAARQAIRERLYTPGELLRKDELAPDLDMARREAEQLDLFGRLAPEPVEVAD
ncbi:MAG: AAA family ATPase, partial [Candidatus Rokuibacteriota bacterium]